MFQNVGLLLRKSALSWYLGEYRNISNWSEFVYKFRQKYLCENYTFEILAEIENRYQAKNESAIVYINDMVNRFRSMPTRLSEEHQCHIIQRNLSRANAMKLAEKRYKSINQLEQDCRNLESMRKHFKISPFPEERFDRLPRYKNNVMVVDESEEMESENSESDSDNDIDETCNVAYSKDKNSRRDVTKNKLRTKPTREFQPKPKQEMKCYNCYAKGHMFINCPVERTRVFCWRCGKEDLTTPECPKCTPKNYNNGSPNKEEPHQSKQ